LWPCITLRSIYARRSIGGSEDDNYLAQEAIKNRIMLSSRCPSRHFHPHWISIRTNSHFRHHTPRQPTSRKLSIPPTHKGRSKAMPQLSALLSLSRTLFSQNPDTSRNPIPSLQEDMYELSDMSDSHSSPSTDVSSRSLFFSISPASTSYSRSSASTRSAYSHRQTSSSQFSYDRTTSSTPFSELRGWSRGRYR
jgi:hypothetical protein